MTDTFSTDALAVPLFGNAGTSTTLLDLLQDAYGDLASGITSVRIAYRDAAYMQSANPDFSYWDPNNASVTRVLNNGVDIGGNGPGTFNLTTVASANFDDITIRAGNNIFPNIYVQVEWANTGTDRHFQELTLATVPGQFNNAAAFDGTPTAAEVVAMARQFATTYNGVPNANDCHWIAGAIGAAAGATLDPMTQSLNTAQNEEGGFWRIAHRGSETHAVVNWSILVQPGDIVRMGWETGGFHTVLVTEGRRASDGAFRVVDNTMQFNGVSSIGEHWVNFDGAQTDPATITIYRLTTDNLYLTNGTAGADKITGTVFADDMRGGNGEDVLSGGDGNDVIDGGEGYDNIFGGDGNDFIFGRNGGGSLWGGEGNDRIDGGIHNDVIKGGGGNDEIRVGDGENSAYGEDGDDVLLGASGVDMLDGGADNDFLTGKEGGDTLNGYSGIDTANYAGSGSAVYVYLANSAWNSGGEAAGDSLLSIENVIGSAFHDVIVGDGAANALSGNWGNDYLAGAGGMDVLSGGIGTDGLYGEAGDDTLSVDYEYSTTVDVMNGGADIDTADFSGSAIAVWVDLAYNGREVWTRDRADVDAGTWREYADLVSIENVFGSQGSDFIQGDAGRNFFVGGDGNDKLYGLGGNDELNPGLGVDEVYGGLGDDLISVSRESNPYGFDTLYGGEGIDTLSFVVNFRYTSVTVDLSTGAYGSTRFYEMENVNGTRFGDRITGDAGPNKLDGRQGADTLAGAAGNDQYFVDNAGDVVNEAANAGTDRVFASVSYALKAGSHVETLTTTDNAGTGAINLTGNELANTIFGNGGANTLDGRGGIDSLNGLGGNDFYFVDNAGDVVNEALNAGTDRVFASVSYALKAGSHVETLTTTDNAGTGAINLTGNELANTIYGNGGANTLDGRGGIDSLNGLGGNDFYFVDNAGDVVNEAANAGTDRVFASVSYALKAGSHVETLTTANNAGTGAINLTGNELANAVYGNAGANVINGGSGNDTLAGFGGADAFVFNSALNAATNVDRISDYNVAADTIWLENAVFTALTAPGALAAGAFFAGSAAHDADDRIVYNAATGALIYDFNGNAVGGATQFATLSPGLSLTHADFLVM